VRAPVSERAVNTPCPVIEGNFGETQRRSSRLTLGAITWKSNSTVSRGHVTAPPPEKRVSGRAPLDRLNTALSPRIRTRPTASRRVTPGSFTRVARESRSMVNGCRSGVAIRIRDTRVAKSASTITFRRPSPLSWIILPGFPRSARRAESTLASVKADLGGFHGRAMRSMPSFIRTLWNSTSGDLPPFEPLPIPSTSS
jgi:hypothetical protein